MPRSIRTIRTARSERTRRRAASSSASSGPRRPRCACCRSDVELEAADGSGALRGRREGRGAAARLRARDRLPGRRDLHACATRTRSCRRSASSTCTSPPRAGTRSSYARLGAHARDLDGVTRRRLLGLGAERARRLGRRRLQRLGRPAAPAALARLDRASGSCSCPAPTPARVQVRGPRRRRQAAPEGRPARGATPRCRPRTRRSSFESRHEWRTRRGSSGGARRRRTPSRCRSTRCTSAPGGTASPTSSSPTSCRLRARPRLHARRADAGDGAPVLGLVGLPGHRLLRAHLALRQPGRVPRARRAAARARASA